MHTYLCGAGYMAALLLNNVLYILQSAIYREAIHNEMVLHRKGYHSILVIMSIIIVIKPDVLN